MNDVDFASEMRALSEQIEEEKNEKKSKEKKSVSKFLDENLEEDDDDEALIYDFSISIISLKREFKNCLIGSEDEEDGNSGKHRMEEEDPETKKSKKKKKDRSEKGERLERRKRSERRVRGEEVEGGEGSEVVEKSERPTREKGTLKKLHKKRDEDNLFDDIVAKRKAKKEPKKTEGELLKEMRQDKETYTMEEPDSPVRTNHDDDTEIKMSTLLLRFEGINRIIN